KSCFSRIRFAFSLPVKTYIQNLFFLVSIFRPIRKATSIGIPGFGKVCPVRVHDPGHLFLLCCCLSLSSPSCMKRVEYKRDLRPVACPIGRSFPCSRRDVTELPNVNRFVFFQKGSCCHPNWLTPTPIGGKFC